jgi:hypothetical protein
MDKKQKTKGEKRKVEESDQKKQDGEKKARIPERKCGICSGPCTFRMSNPCGFGVCNSVICFHCSWAKFEVCARCAKRNADAECVPCSECGEDVIANNMDDETRCLGCNRFWCDKHRGEQFCPVCRLQKKREEETSDGGEDIELTK